MNVVRSIVVAALFVGAAAFLSGCSSGPSADELAQLDQLKSETESLKKEVAAMQAEKDSLESQITKKREELAAAENNQKLTRERLNSQH
ncbi:MAG TPA: hypothetical protein VMG34_10390 [Bacteroidota bacterium]|nr:hypothetical protein [Bacteroidota bacterium]